MGQSKEINLNWRGPTNFNFLMPGDSKKVTHT